MTTHNIRIRREIRKILSGYPPLIYSYALKYSALEYKHLDANCIKISYYKPVLLPFEPQHEKTYLLT